MYSFSYIRIASFCVICLLAYAPHLSGEPIAFSADVNGQPRGTAIETVDVHGVPYVSLARLVRDLGGGMRAEEGRVVVDMLGESAQIAIRDTRVESSLNTFLTTHPVAVLDGEVLLSARDIEPFFSQAFGLTLRRGVPEATATASLETDSLALAAPPIATAPTVEEPPAEAASAPPIATPEETAETLAAPPIAAPEDAAEALAAPPIASPEEMAAPPESQHSASQEWSGKIEGIVIDAGHGGDDAGFTGASGLAEKDFALGVAKMLRDILQAASKIRVFMTRESDTAMSAAERMQFANRQQADLFVSIHGGVSMSARAHGVAVLYPPARDLEAAASVAGALSGRIAEATGAETLCMRPTALRVFDGLKMAGILIEPGCLTNPAEEALLATEEYQRRIAQGIAVALASPAPEPAGDTKQNDEKQKP